MLGGGCFVLLKCRPVCVQLGFCLKCEKGGGKIYLAAFMTCVFSNFAGIFDIIQTFSLQPCTVQRQRLTPMNVHRFQEVIR